MTPAAEILHRCRAAGLTLRRNGDRLDIRPARLVTPELLARIRAAKPVLLDLLEAESARLAPDCAPWLHVAKQILSGEFVGADRCLLESLLIGVRNIPHPLCQHARARLGTLLGRNHKEAQR
jgi:hypothetical protein